MRTSNCLLFMGVGPTRDRLSRKYLKSLGNGVPYEIPEEPLRQRLLGHVTHRHHKQKSNQKPVCLSGSQMQINANLSNCKQRAGPIRSQ